MVLPATYVEGFHDAVTVGKMPYRRLGITKLELSLLSFGGAAFGGFYGDVAEAEGIALVQDAVRQGINYIDTAPFYGDGRSEAIIGKALKTIPREAYYISTKVGRYKGEMKEQFDYTPEKIKSRFETSLKLLGLDYVDMLLVHDVEFVKLYDLLKVVLPAVAELKAEGKTKYIGISGYPVCRLGEVVCKSEGLDFILCYSRDTLLDSTLRKYYPLFKNKGVGVINASPNSQRLLTNMGPPDWQCASEDIKELCAQAASYCKDNGVELGKLAVHYGLTSPISETVLVGMTSKEVLQMNLDTVWNKLSQKEQDVYDYIKAHILTLERDRHWEGVELKMYKMAMN